MFHRVSIHLRARLSCVFPLVHLIKTIPSLSELYSSTPFGVDFCSLFALRSCLLRHIRRQRNHVLDWFSIKLVGFSSSMWLSLARFFSSSGILAFCSRDDKIPVYFAHFSGVSWLNWLVLMCRIRQAFGVNGRHEPSLIKNSRHRVDDYKM